MSCTLSKEEHFYRNEYENLRRKKKAEIEHLNGQIYTICENTIDYLVSRRLLDDYLKFVVDKRKEKE